MPYSNVDSAKMLKYNPKVDFRIIHQGVSGDFHKIPQNEPRHILFIGRFDIAQKGIDLLLHAYAKAKKDLKYPLVLAGHGPDEKSIRILIDKLGLQDKVSIVGAAYGKKKSELISQAIFTAFPSTHEEMSLWSLESLAAGLPLVCFDLPEHQWMNEHISFRAKAFDIDEYAKLLKIASDKQNIKPMREASKKFASQFEWEKVVNEFVDYFNVILAKGKHAANTSHNK